jgi:hypothetical protein
MITWDQFNRDYTKARQEGRVRPSPRKIRRKAWRNWARPSFLDMIRSEKAAGLWEGKG